MKTNTRENIQGCFLELLEESPFSHITVKDIVERCAINRNTFYYYFQDMAALAEAVAEEEFLPLPEESLSHNTVEDTLNAVISRTLEHRQAALKIYHSANRERFELSMWRISQHVVGQFLNAILKDRTILPDDRAFLQNYQRSVLFGMTMDWLQQGLDPLARQDVHRICELLQRHLELELKELEEKAKGAH